MFCMGNQIDILNIVILKFDLLRKTSWWVAFCIASMFLFLQTKFPSHNCNEFRGYVTFTPARRPGNKNCQDKDLWCVPVRTPPSVSANNCQLNHMALAHMKLTPALTSSCLTFSHTCIYSQMAPQQSHWHAIYDFIGTSRMPFDPRAHLYYSAAYEQKGGLVHIWYMYGMSFKMPCI